jgi:hypothetical protein
MRAVPQNSGEGLKPLPHSQWKRRITFAKPDFNFGNPAVTSDLRLTEVIYILFPPQSHLWIGPAAFPPHTAFADGPRFLEVWLYRFEIGLQPLVYLPGEISPIKRNEDA